MTNRIERLSVSHHVMDPTYAEVWFAVYPERLTSTTDVHGHLTGPRCAHATTVEVAYPVRPHSRTYEKEGDPRIIVRVVIPEPSLWEPQTPFLYEGRVELWQSGQCCEQVSVSRGLRELKLIPQGLRLNGRPFSVRAAAGDKFSPEDLPRLRQAGFNTVFAPVGPDSAELWVAADRLGLFMLGQVRNRDSIRHGETLSEHPSCLGFAMAVGAEEAEILWILMTTLFPGSEPNRVGCELNEPPAKPLPDACRFILCDHAALPDFAGVALPKLVRIARPALDEATSAALLSTPGVLGWVLDPAA